MEETKKGYMTNLKNLTSMELLVLASEVNSTNDREFLNEITDEFKRRNEEKK